jgi:hypothetical protein
MFYTRRNARFQELNGCTGTFGISSFFFTKLEVGDLTDLLREAIGEHNAKTYDVGGGGGGGGRSRP